MWYVCLRYFYIYHPAIWYILYLSFGYTGDWVDYSLSNPRVGVDVRSGDGLEENQGTQGNQGGGAQGEERYVYW